MVFSKDGINSDYSGSVRVQGTTSDSSCTQDLRRVFEVASVQTKAHSGALER